MATTKNLLEQDYLKNSIYGNAEKVKAIHDRYTNVISQMRTPGSELNQAMVSELKELYRILLEQEATFYDMLGTNSPKEAIQKLKDEIEIWHNGGAGILMLPETTRAVFGIVVSMISTEQVMEIFQQYISQHQSRFDELVLQEINNTNENSPLNVKKIIDNFMKGKNFSRKTSLATLTLQINKQNSYTISTNGGQLSNTVKADILDIISQEVDVNGNQTQLGQKAKQLLENSGLKDSTISRRICEELQNRGIRGTVYERIAKEIKLGGRGKKPYARWGNYFVIQGYLGEVYWNAFMKNLFSNGRGIRATGNVKNLAGKSLSVDMIVKNIGFQIKHWSLQNTEGELSHQSEKTVKFGTFLSTGAEMLQSDIGKIIAQMFGSLSYNRVLKDGEYSEESQAFLEYQDLRDEMNDTKIDSYDDLEFLFQSKLHKILGIAGSGGIERIQKGEAFVRGKQYYNTFWAINEDIIPSSLIIEELIKVVQENSFTTLATFNIAGMQDTGTIYWPSKVDYSDQAMANRWKISYNTKFNMTKLLNAAVQRV